MKSLMHRSIAPRLSAFIRLRGVMSLWISCSFAVAGLAASCSSAATDLPQPVRGRTPAESSPPSWPRTASAPAGAPNVLVIMTDDVGFGASSTFGGPIPTPTLDALARSGLRYNRFHTTAICSPTRAALLTGRNPHNVGIGNTTNLPTGYEGYNSVIPPSAGTVAEILRVSGYSTAMFGKGHLTPEWEMSRIGPFARWPTGLGFDYFYGFLGADISMFAPTLVENTSFIEPPYDDPSYHFDGDLADHAVGWIEQQHALAPRQPFFVYYAPGTAHAPNHAPTAWLAKFRGKFDEGWDQVRADIVARQKRLGVIPANTLDAPRPHNLPRWSSLSAEQRRVYARFMEAYAASLAYADEQIGRVIEAVRHSGELDNTLIIFIQGDNGASAEGRLDGRVFEQSGINSLDEGLDYLLRRIDDIGGPQTYPLLPGGWGWAMNAPFPWYKRIASHLGGTRNGVVISWPSRIKDAGGLRQQFHHVSDIMPTILQSAGISAPSMLRGVPQQPLDGVSMAYTFGAPDAPSQRTTQVFEMFENLGIYHQGWWAATRPTGTAWDANKTTVVPLDKRVWELYDLNTDFNQARDLARQQPEKLSQLQSLFWAEAARNNILPIHGPNEGREGMPTLTQGRNTFTYYAGMIGIPENSAPHTLRRSFTIAAHVVIPDSGADGVLVAQGGQFGGYSFYIHQGQVVFYYNAIDPRRYAVRTDRKLSPGEHQLTADFDADPTRGGAVTIAINGEVAARGRIEQTLTQWISHSEGFDVGKDAITPVSTDYTSANSTFRGELKKLVVTLR